MAGSGPYGATDGTPQLDPVRGIARNETEANDDFQGLQDACAAGLDIVGVVVMTHSAEGDPDVWETGDRDDDVEEAVRTSAHQITDSF